MEEIVGFLSYQLRERWWLSLRGRASFSRHLATAELRGALMGLAGYWRGPI